MTVVSVLMVVAGVLVLAKGSDAFVAGAARLARRWNVAPMIVGLLIVGFGTSAPEALSSAVAALEGKVDLAIGNIVGSNVANLTLVLGAAGLFAPLVVSSTTLRREVPLTVAAAGLFALLVRDGLSPSESALLLASFTAVMALLLWTGRREDWPSGPEPAAAASSAGREGVRTLAGLGATVGGAWLLVTGAVAIAAAAGLSEGFVGFTLVAIGTSLPELMTAIAAARQGHSEMLVGNVLGSCLFNSLAVAGLTGLLGSAPLGDAGLVAFSALAMVGVTLAAWALLVRRLGRWEAGVLLAAYPLLLVLL